MQECRLAARDLACRRGERILFAGVSFALEPGEALQLVGPNGIGKSSLIRIVAGLMQAFGGAVERTGACGLVDERPALDPLLPLGEALAFWRRIDGPTDNELARLGLSDLADVPVRYLSTGQKKRAALARLLGQDAPVWLLDEPLNGLDRSAAALARELVAEHCAAGGICVIASHQEFALPALRRIDMAEHAA
ncbi:cytochrome c biogenesis ATP-binding export protein CcmA [Novosphingobium marinum]|uniref:Heme exporter protein A n=1 Tax=Novosphingobium marinum TaxID=1514948 RepID=A0A7Y9XVA3_9SPHN|nr:heme ABC exporter ATP-binding protein CcmA [Novosphingobium marinum]NYH95234.1 heme exporter protein A [Novosphingobium marinum]GGC25402.1 cytochrome c biogenesis ATP-binding export protein CcmA [Novosphingobium marinum]